VAAELLKTSRVRSIKQARFRRGLMMTVVSFVALGANSFPEALPSSDGKRAPTETPQERQTIGLTMSATTRKYLRYECSSTASRPSHETPSSL
jgi:hypothetical protein